MNRALLEQALRESQSLAARHPDVATIPTITTQLKYLLDFDAGEADEARLSDIILGVQAAREIEPLDPELANMLYDIAAEVKVIQAAAVPRSVTRTRSITIEEVIELAEAEGNEIRDVSTGWTKVRAVVHMKRPLSDRLRALAAADPRLRYWSAAATPHNRAECGFTDDGKSVSISFPVSDTP